MPSLTDIGSLFNTIREVDLTPIREAAEQQTWLAIVGSDSGAAHDLATALYLAPRQLPMNDASFDMAGPLVTTADNADKADRADLIIFVFDEAHVPTTSERELYNRWLVAGKKIIVIFNQLTSQSVAGRQDWAGARVLQGQVTSREFLDRQFVPAVLNLLPENKLSLARNYPLFRPAVARDVVNETSFANGSYALTTGLAEILPILNIPFNVADMIVLTKAQAFMMYRLGLAFGLSTRWQDHLTAFGSTVGAGFVWRTIARQLAGLVPALGIVPKVAIAYAGTYAMGRGGLEWYETGRDVKREDLDRFFKEALVRGKALGTSLTARAPALPVPKIRRFPFRKRQDPPLALPNETGDS